jgi:hypothetical protein
MYNARYFCHDLMKFVFSLQIFEKILQYKYSWKSIEQEAIFSVWRDRLLIPISKQPQNLYDIYLMLYVQF